MLITFEGGDGAGKSTQVGALADRLRATGRKVVCVREPGGTDLGERIRALVKHDLSQDLTPPAEVFLFAAARAQLVADVIRPALDRGAVVLCDRFVDSTLAYQGYGLDLDLSALRRINDLATGRLVPDRTILLDLDPALGLARHGGPNAADRFDVRGLPFRERVRAGYLALAAAEPARFLTLPADLPPTTLTDQIYEGVRNQLTDSQMSV